MNDGNTVHVMEALRGGGTHTQKKSKGRTDKDRARTFPVLRNYVEHSVRVQEP